MHALLLALLLLMPADLPDFDTLWDYQNPSKTESVFRELLPQARKAGDGEYLAQLLTQVARAECLQRKFAESARTLDEVEKQLAGRESVARIRLLLERGRLANDTKQGDRGRALFLRAWDLGRKLGADNLAVDAAHMLGIVDPPDQALEWNRRALAYAEASKDERARSWRGTLYNNTGWTHFEKKEYATALECFQKSLAAYQERERERQVRIAKWSIAKTLRMLGRVTEALGQQEALLKEWEAAGETDGYVFEELGECLLALGRTLEARPHFARAYAELSKDSWLKANAPARLERLRTLGMVSGE